VNRSRSGLFDDHHCNSYNAEVAEFHIACLVVRDEHDDESRVLIHYRAKNAMSSLHPPRNH
jgi:hypothetical protein